jgi:hypothetical protein
MPWPLQSQAQVVLRGTNEGASNRFEHPAFPPKSRAALTALRLCAVQAMGLRSLLLVCLMQSAVAVSAAGAAQSNVLPGLASDLSQRLHALQHPPDCTSARLLLVDLRNEGLGAELALLAVKLNAAYWSGRTLVVEPDSVKHWNYRPTTCGARAAEQPEAEQHELGCWLQSLSSCDVSKHVHADEPRVPWTEWASAARVVTLFEAAPLSPFYTQAVASQPLLGALTAWFVRRDDLAVPTRYRRPLQAVSASLSAKEWWVSQLIGGFLLRPTAALREAVTKRTHAIQWTHALPFAPPPPPAPALSFGVHIRHGDKPSEGGAVVPFQDYWAAVLALTKQITAERCSAAAATAATGSAAGSGRACPTHADVIFATDDEAMIAEVQRMQRTLQPCPDSDLDPVAAAAAATSSLPPTASPSLPLPMRLFVYSNHDRSAFPTERDAPSLASLLRASKSAPTAAAVQPPVSAATREAQLLEALTDWFSLGAASDGFVGTASSNFGCVAYVMMVYRYVSAADTSLPPPRFVSLDWSHCNFFGLSTDPLASFPPLEPLEPFH